MGEYIPTEQELVDVLCAIRETDWEAAVKRSNNYRSNSDSIRIRGGYKRFIKDFKNLRDISQEYMRTPAQWWYCTFPFILGQIVNSPKEDQRLLLELVDRHKVAARERLLDVVWWEWYEAGEDKSLLERKPLPEIVEQRVEERLNRFPQDSLGDGDKNNKVMWEFLGDSEWQEFGVDAKSLVWRVLVAQKLLELIDNALCQVQQQTAPPAGDQEQGDVVAFEILQEMYDSASEKEREQYFRSSQGRHKKGVDNQDIYFEPALKRFNKANKGGLEMSTFIKIVGRFKKTLTD